MPESIRNAIVVAFIAVLVAMVGVGLLLWRGRPAAPAAQPEQGLPLLVTDRNGGLYDLNVKVKQIERRLGASQTIDLQLLEAVKSSNQEREQLAKQLTGLQKEVRILRKQLEETEQHQAPRQPPAQLSPPKAPAATVIPPATTPGTTDVTPPPP